MDVVSKQGGRITLLSDLIRKAIRDRFPEIEVSPNGDFWPMPSLEGGELSSSAAIEIARAVKQNAEGIADQIILSVSREVPAEWRHDRGYIVCRGAPERYILSEVDDSVADALRRLTAGELAAKPQVWCLIPDNTTPTYARIRIVARAALQALLTVTYEGPCFVCFHPCPGELVSSRRRVIELFRASVEYVLAHEAEERVLQVLPQELLSDPAGRISVWTTHHYHERMPAEVRVHVAQARVAGRMRPIMPADGWLLSRDRGLSGTLSNSSLQATVRKLSDDDYWMRFLFHTAGTVASGDFDPAVALFDEWASPLWSYWALVERFKRFKYWYKLPVGSAALKGVFEPGIGERPLLIGSVLLPAYTARAIACGEIGAWSEALEWVSRRGHVFINSPQTRLYLERGELDSNSGKIAAGLGFGLSCILPLVVEGACEDQQQRAGET